MLEKKGNGPVAKKRYPRPTRQKFKKQITVRIDENLLEAAIAEAGTRNLRLTDAIEDGLWLYLKRKPPAEVRQLRFLCSVLPLRLQRLTVSFWSFMSGPRKGIAEVAFQQQLEFLLTRFREDAENAESYAEGLRRLEASSSAAGDEAAS
jgi:hypothetical protein